MGDRIGKDREFLAYPAALFDDCCDNDLAVPREIDSLGDRCSRLEQRLSPLAGRTTAVSEALTGVLALRPWLS